jgi:hypothetical protein
MTKVHINDRADMSVFDGTAFAGKTYMQVRRMLTPEQQSRLRALNKRDRRVQRKIRDDKRFIGT